MMTDAECPHGLDPSWCTFCRNKAAGVLPSGVRRPRAAPAPRARRTSAARQPAIRGAVASPRGPAQALVGLRKVLFHASAYGAWPAIADLGLLTTNQLLDGDPRLGQPRLQSLRLMHPSGHDISVRDQRTMMRSNIETHLDGIKLNEWLGILNQRVFLFVRQKDLTTFLGGYQETEGQDVVVFDTARLLAAAKGRIEVTTVHSTAPVPWDRCLCRNRETFEPIESFTGDVADIAEVTIIDGIDQAADLVVRVVRYHPDRTTEVLVA